MAWNWGIGIITFAFGLGIGFAAAYALIPRGQRIRELEQELAAARAALEDYRGQVSRHFQKTAELFEDMTDRYRAVYRHMAQSAQTLCEEQPPALQLEIVDRGRLTTAAAAAAAEAPRPVARAPASADADADAEIDLHADIPPADAVPARPRDDEDDYLGDAPQVPNLDDEERGAART
ncbi:MAG: YhcB family protein [Gammaproteobacteria bacterium]|nr:YhcB family protein [Gammaproteobacteria bacterium]